MSLQSGCMSLLDSHAAITFHPQGSKVVIPLQVQLAGEDRWIRVNISCPLIKARSERTQPRPTREWRQLIELDKLTDPVVSCIPKISSPFSSVKSHPGTISPRSQV